MPELTRSAFVSALIIGLVAQLYARWPRHFPATILVPGFLQLAVGFLGPDATMGLPDPRRSTTDALQLVAGIAVAELLAGPSWLRRAERL